MPVCMCMLVPKANSKFMMQLKVTSANIVMITVLGKLIIIKSYLYSRMTSPIFWHHNKDDIIMHS